jgi:hypothetical protein
MSPPQAADVTQPLYEKAVGKPMQTATVHVKSADWLTPGAFLAEQLARCREVRMILERFEKERYAVIIVLERDPEDLLDRIFDTERELYTLYRGLPFDVRVMTPPPSWRPDDLLQGAFAHYMRPEDHGNR